MKTVKQLVEEAELSDLAISSNIGYGTKMFERGGVEIVAVSDGEIEAWAGGLDGNAKSGGGSRRRVWLYAGDDGLTWHCSGNPKDHDIFCKHCVAVALKVVSL